MYLSLSIFRFIKLFRPDSGGGWTPVTGDGAVLELLRAVREGKASGEGVADERASDGGDGKKPSDVSATVDMAEPAVGNDSVVDSKKPSDTSAAADRAEPADEKGPSVGELSGRDAHPHQTETEEARQSTALEAHGQTAEGEVGGEPRGGRSIFRSKRDGGSESPERGTEPERLTPATPSNADTKNSGPNTKKGKKTEKSEKGGMSSWVGGFAAALICTFLLAGPISWSFFAGDLYYIRDDEGDLAGCVMTHRDARTAYSEVIELEEEDKVVSETVGSTEFLSVVRAFSVTVSADGAKTEVKLTEGTVEDALAAAKVELGDDDVVSPSLATELSDGDVVTVKRVTYKTREETEMITGEQIIKRTPLIADGSSEVANEESLGEVVRVYRDRYVDGVLDGSEIVSEQTTKAPTSSVVLEGDSSAVMSSVNGAQFTSVSIVGGVPSEYISVVSGRSTAYSSTRSVVYGASGLYLRQGFVAVNPDVIPYGSLLYITSSDGSFVYGWAIAADTGAALLDGSAVVDCFFETYRESCLFGAHTLDVYVVKQLTQSELEGYMGNEGLFRSRIPE